MNSDAEFGYDASPSYPTLEELLICGMGKQLCQDLD